MKSVYLLILFKLIVHVEEIGSLSAIQRLKAQARLLALVVNSAVSHSVPL